MFKLFHFLFVLFFLFSLLNSSFCQSTCDDDSDCDDDEWCLFEIGTCGEGNSQGNCEPIADVFCIIADPVCGCDGQNYQSSCEALSNQVSILSDGPCGSDDDNGGSCDDDSDCDSDSFCRYEDGECGGSGICTERPDVCYEIFTPTCGCDRKDYGNPCEAFGDGVSIAPLKDCGVYCYEDDDCPDDENCQFPCNVDSFGVCDSQDVYDCRDDDSNGSNAGSSSNSDSNTLKFNFIVGFIVMISLYLLF
eukprot:TRINITY_DN744_c0_g3_i2.p1 TRINITY_DN744_c0_g3~~TRINITY_DN744_c0_g3_i2.p1  ORF type:complete len:248 (+),score=99.18 TRINITY_DN744_c0_g3_i2:128-871(+)